MTRSRIVVLGAGVCGLAAGMLLRRDGYEVTILERDPAPVPPSPSEAWERWTRGGVVQFRQPHYLHSRGRIMLDEELPDVVSALDAAGCLRFDPLRLMPPPITDRTPRIGDERFRTITARRPVLEQVMGAAGDAEPGLDVRRGVAVKELVMRAYNGTPHVGGVRTSAGEELLADLVIDATGRSSQLPRWLAQAGTRPIHEEVEDQGFVYYTRYFRSRNGELPEFRAPILTPVGTFSVLTLPCDNETWSVTLFISGRDQALKRLRHPGPWATLVAACPQHSQWLDGEPLDGVAAMVTDAELTPWYRENVAEDRVRMAEIEALRNGLEPDRPSTSAALLRQALLAAVPQDPDVFRAFLASRACLTLLEESLSDQKLVARILELAAEADRPPLAGPDRLRLLELLDGAQLAHARN